MDKLREYLHRELKRIDDKLENYHDSDGQIYRSFLEGKSEALVDIVNLLERIPSEDSMVQGYRELADAQEKHMDRQSALIEKQTALIKTLMDGRK